ncbi:MFS transporter [Microbacterium testaceum]|uniref:MFS transporter n=1 Tax=Microbacterium testaceum TaxID=2033 RepID=UPI003827CFD4
MNSLTPIRSALGRDFRRFWLAQSTSAVGSQVGDLAVPLLAVVVLHATAAEAGLVGVARWLPFLLLALPLGVVVDRRRRRPVLVTADLARAALIVILAVVAVTGSLTLPALLGLIFAMGAFTVAFEVAYQSFLPTVVARDDLERANGRLQATASAAQVGGPGLGGWLVQTLTAPWALLSQAVTYVVSAAALLGIRSSEHDPTRERRGALAQLREGLRYVRGDRYLVSLVGFSAIYNLFAQWITVLLLVYAVRELGLSAGHLGLVFSLGAVGAVVGAAAAPASVRRFGVGPVLIACAGAESLVLAVIPVVDAAWSTPLIVVALVAVFAVNGAGTSLSSVVTLTLRQLRTPDQLLGRVNATVRWISYGVVAIGAGLGGLAGEAMGTRAGIALGCVGVALTVAWVAVSPLRTVRDAASLAVH